MRSRLPPSRRQSGTPACRAARSQSAVSMPAITWAIGPGSPACSARRCERALSSAKACAGDDHSRPIDPGPEHALQEARAVLGAAGRKIAPDLAVADGAAAFGADDHRRPVGHGAERRAHRPLDRRAIDRDVEPVDAQRCRLRQGHGVRPRRCRARSPRPARRPRSRRRAPGPACSGRAGCRARGARRGCGARSRRAAAPRRPGSPAAMP